MNDFTFTPLDDYVRIHKDIEAGYVGRFDGGVGDNHGGIYLPPSNLETLNKPMLAAVDLHLRWVADFHKPEDLEMRTDPDDWGRYVKERQDTIFFDTGYELPNYKMKVVSISTAFVIACVYRQRRGSNVPKSLNRKMRRLVNKLVPTPRAPHLHAI